MLVCMYGMCVWLQGMLHAALQYRQRKADVFKASLDLHPLPEYIPWTSTAGRTGIRTLLRKQVHHVLVIIEKKYFGI